MLESGVDPLSAGLPPAPPAPALPPEPPPAPALPLEPARPPPPPTPPPAAPPVPPVSPVPPWPSPPRPPLPPTPPVPPPLPPVPVPVPPDPELPPEPALPPTSAPGHGGSGWGLRQRSLPAQASNPIAKREVPSSSNQRSRTMTLTASTFRTSRDRCRLTRWREGAWLGVAHFVPRDGVSRSYPS
jgi:hypothetical protein